MISIACFFQADDESLDDFYGPPCFNEVVRSIKRCPNIAPTRLLRGDLILSRYAYKVSSVTASSGTISTSYLGDKNAHQLIVLDFIDSFRQGFHTIDTENFYSVYARSTIWTVVIVQADIESAKIIHSNLQHFSPYIGLAEIDPGNPVHIKTLTLLEGGYIKDQTLFMVSVPEGQDLSNEYRVKEYGCTIQDEETYFKYLPPSLEQSSLSHRGELTTARIEGKSRLTHHQQIALKLSNLLSGTQVGDLIFETDFDLSKGEFLCEETKLTGYLLNLSHIEGASKANFFINILGIFPEDWRFLANQIMQGMRTAAIFRIFDTPHGMTHGAFIKISGRNGKEAVIQTGWEIKKGSPARLTTAYPASNAVLEDFESTYVQIPPLNIIGDDRWKIIYSIAHSFGIEEANNTVPTPMVIPGYDTIFPGMCGKAWIHFPNARFEFVRWLKKHGLGYKGYKRGWNVSVSFDSVRLKFGDAQSIEPKVAYAKTFAQILVANGIACHAESRLD